jgi:uncharacterized protein
VDKLFQKKYSVELPKLQFGLNEDTFEIDSSFFAEFEFSPVHDGNVQVAVVIDKSSTHLDAKFHFKGEIMIECDRCLEPYPFPLDLETRIVYAFDEELEFDTDEVVLIEETTPIIHIAQDLYEIIILQIPLRRVPETDVHLCAPQVMELLGLNPDGSPKESEVVEEGTESEEIIDPRWQALKKLKDSKE